MEALRPNIYAFEPIQDYRQVLHDKFAATNGKVRIIPYGIASVEKRVTVQLAGDATTALPRGVVSRSNIGARSMVLKPLDTFFLDEFDGFDVDLLFINCEGCEYDVLSYLVGSPYISRMRHILVQFHPLGDQWLQKRCCIAQRLSHTHDVYFDYPNIWTGWALRQGSRG